VPAPGLKHNKFDVDWALALTSVGSVGLSSARMAPGGSEVHSDELLKGPIWRCNSILVAKYHQNCPFCGAQFPLVNANRDMDAISFVLQIGLKSP
jgi:hypothetical protein